jgi:hypothetical protein
MGHCCAPWPCRRERNTLGHRRLRDKAESVIRQSCALSGGTASEFGPSRMRVRIVRTVTRPAALPDTGAKQPRLDVTAFPHSHPALTNLPSQAREIVPCARARLGAFLVASRPCLLNGVGAGLTSPQLSSFENMRNVARSFVKNGTRYFVLTKSYAGWRTRSEATHLVLQGQDEWSQR